MVDGSGESELRRSAAFFRGYASLFRDDQVRRALTDYAALLEAKADRTTIQLLSLTA
jgi:hypothetical protein